MWRPSSEASPRWGALFLSWAAHTVVPRTYTRCQVLHYKLDPVLPNAYEPKRRKISWEFSFNDFIYLFIFLVNLPFSTRAIFPLKNISPIIIDYVTPFLKIWELTRLHL